MKTIFFHLQGYRNLPDNFRDRYESIWATLPNKELCDPREVHRYLNWNVDELELADDLGFDGIGVNEHHSNGYSFSGSPNLTASILARRKSDAAIMLLGNTLTQYNPPTRVAEELATLDCMSGGRIIAGMPVGSPMDTTIVHGITPTEVRARYHEAHDLIKRAWTESGPFPFNGKYHKLRYVNPWPQPLQRPHPPIWLGGGGSPETWKFATDNDYVYTYLSWGGHKYGKELMDGFWRTVEHEGLDDNPYRAGFAQVVVVADTDAEAERIYMPHIRDFFDKAMYVAPHHAFIPGYFKKASLQSFLTKPGQSKKNAPFGVPAGRDMTWKQHVEQEAMVIGGSPSTVADKLTEAVKSLRVGHLMVILQLATMTREDTERNTRLFAEQVLPKIRHIWDDQGYVDHWWPKGATRNSPAAARQPAPTLTEAPA